MKSCTPLWREAHLEVKMSKAHHSRTTFGRLICRKSARRCGAKQISKSKVLKTDGFEALLEVEKLKKRTPLWREAHFEAHMHKTRIKTLHSEHFWKLRSKKCTPLWREADSTSASEHFWQFRC